MIKKQSLFIRFHCTVEIPFFSTASRLPLCILLISFLHPPVGRRSCVGTAEKEKDPCLSLFRSVQKQLPHFLQNFCGLLEEQQTEETFHAQIPARNAGQSRKDTLLYVMKHPGTEQGLSESYESKSPSRFQKKALLNCRAGRKEKPAFAIRDTEKSTAHFP